MIILASLPMCGARASSAAGCSSPLPGAPLAHAGPRHASRRRRRRGGPARVSSTIPTFLFARNPDRVHVPENRRANFRPAGRDIGDARLALYRDTWRLFEQQPVFGWGWHSFQYVFPRVQSSEFKMQNEQRLKSVFTDAHNDWLQWLAELGLVGALLGLGALVGVARAASARCWGMSPSFEILAGLGCLGLLACVDFPFACPAIVVTAWTLLATAAGIACRRELQVPRSA